MPYWLLIKNDDIGCMIITGSEKAFAAGADIAAMAGYNYMDAYKGNYVTKNWEHILACEKTSNCSGGWLCTWAAAVNSP